MATLWFEQLKITGQTLWRNALPESLLIILGTVSIIVGAAVAWQQKRILPLLLFGTIGVAIMIIF